MGKTILSAGGVMLFLGVGAWAEPPGEGARTDGVAGDVIEAGKEILGDALGGAGTGEAAGAGADAGAAAAATGAEAPDVAAAPPSGARSYTVRSGDTLGSIAAQELGSSGRYNEIYEANRESLSDPNRIEPGQVLRLP